MRLLRRVSSLPGADWRLLGECLIEILVAHVTLTFVPFRRIAQAAAAAPGGEGRESEIDQISQSLKLAARCVPRTDCLCLAVAACRIMRRRGLPLVIHIGFDRSRGRPFLAHAWTESGGRIVSGDSPVLDNLVELSVFGSREQV